MKYLFICDWDYTLLWKAVATEMLEKKLIKSASALIVGKIFYDQLTSKPHPFSSIYLLQDETEKMPDYIEGIDQKLKTLEERYSEQRLWRFVWADRSWVKCSHDEIKKRLVVCFDYFEKLLANEKPDLILTNAYASMPHLILYEVARKMEIPIIRPVSLRLGSHYIISDSAMEDESWIVDYMTGKKHPSSQSIEKAKQFVKAFRENLPAPSYQKIINAQRMVTFGHFFRFFRYMYRFWIAQSFKGDHTKPNPFVRLIREAKWRLKKRHLLKKTQWDIFNEKEEYVYFPLHVQPEMSTMTYAPYYLDQIAIIENISKSLPITYKLIVKEHPSMLGRRDKNYYKRLRSLSNVVLIYPYEENKKILNNTKLIVTITGTTGLEGMILKKPVILFGSVYFRFCPLIYDASHVAPTDWVGLIDKALHYNHDEETLVTFLATVFDKSFEGIYVEPLARPDLVLEKQNLETLIASILSHVKR